MNTTCVVDSSCRALTCCDGGLTTGLVANLTLCACASSKSSSHETQEKIQIGLVIGFVILATGCYFYSNGRPRRRHQSEDIEMVNQLTLENAKNLLVPTDPSGVCSICLDDVTDDAIRPPHCYHVFHRACLCNWIDQAGTKAKGSSSSERMLACPVCSRPFAHDDEDDELQTLTHV